MTNSPDPRYKQIEPLNRPEIALPNELGRWVLLATDKLNEVIAREE